MKVLFVFILGLLFGVKSLSQMHINFVLEIDDELIEEPFVRGVTFSYIDTFSKKDSIVAFYTLGELQLSNQDYFKLEELPDTTTINVAFYYGTWNSGMPKIISFYIPKAHFFQRYLRVRFFGNKSKNGMCGFEYHSPLGSRNLPIYYKRFLWWKRLRRKCPDENN